MTRYERVGERGSVITLQRLAAYFLSANCPNWRRGVRFRPKSKPGSDLDIPPSPPNELAGRGRLHYHFLYGRNLPFIVTTTRSPLGSSFFCTSNSKSIALMMPSPNIS